MKRSRIILIFIVLLSNLIGDRYNLWTMRNSNEILPISQSLIGSVTYAQMWWCRYSYTGQHVANYYQIAHNGTGVSNFILPWWTIFPPYYTLPSETLLMNSHLWAIVTGGVFNRIWWVIWVVTIWIPNGTGDYYFMELDWTLVAHPFTSTCASCGDSIINQWYEQCDDGNTTNRDACSATCQWETPLCTLIATPNPTYTNTWTMIHVNIPIVAPNYGWIWFTWFIFGDWSWMSITSTGAYGHSYISWWSYTSQLTVYNKSWWNSSTCTVNVWVNRCGNWSTQWAFGEQCDSGPSNGVPCSPWYGTTCSYCSLSCINTIVTWAYCGDGIVQWWNGELCDFGDTSNNDGCSSTCQWETPTCVIDGTPNNGLSPLTSQFSRTMSPWANTTSIHFGDLVTVFNPVSPISHIYISPWLYLITLLINSSLPWSPTTWSCSTFITVVTTPWTNGVCDPTTYLSTQYNLNNWWSALNSWSLWLCLFGIVSWFTYNGWTDQRTWTCAGTGWWTSQSCQAFESWCGDGILWTWMWYNNTEQCDDNNNLSNDGCGPLCQWETPSCILNATPNNGIAPLSSTLSRWPFAWRISSQTLNLGNGTPVIITPISPQSASYLTAWTYTPILTIFNNLTWANTTASCSSVITVLPTPIPWQCTSVSWTYYIPFDTLPLLTGLCATGPLSNLIQWSTWRSWLCLWSNGWTNASCSFGVQSCGDSIIQSWYGEQCDNQSWCDSTTCLWLTWWGTWQWMCSSWILPIYYSWVNPLPSTWSLCTSGILSWLMQTPTGWSWWCTVVTWSSQTWCTFSITYCGDGITQTWNWEQCDGQLWCNPLTCQRITWIIMTWWIGLCSTWLLWFYYSWVNPLPNTWSLCTTGTLSGLIQSVTSWSWSCVSLSWTSQTWCAFGIGYCGDGITQPWYGEQCDGQLSCNNTTCTWALSTWWTINGPWWPYVSYPLWYRWTWSTGSQLINNTIQWTPMEILITTVHLWWKKLRRMIELPDEIIHKLLPEYIYGLEWLTYIPWIGVISIDTLKSITSNTTSLINYLPKIASSSVWPIITPSDKPFVPSYIPEKNNTLSSSSLLNSTTIIDLATYDAQPKIIPTNTSLSTHSLNRLTIVSKDNLWMKWNTMYHAQPLQSSNKSVSWIGIGQAGIIGSSWPITNTLTNFEIDVKSLKQVFTCQNQTYSTSTLEQCIKTLPKGLCSILNSTNNILSINKDKIDSCLEEVTQYQEPYEAVKGWLYIEHYDKQAQQIVQFLKQFIPSLSVRTDIFDPYLPGFARIEFDPHIANRHIFWLLKHLWIQNYTEFAYNPYPIILFHIATAGQVQTQLAPTKVQLLGSFYNDPLVTKQTYLDTIWYPQALNSCNWDSNQIIKVAVVDSAFETDHEDLTSPIKATQDIANKDSNVDPPFGKTEDSERAHGTYSAWIIWAQTNNQKGVISIAWSSSELFLYKAAHDNGPWSDIGYWAEAIVTAAKGKPHIISLSWWAYINDTKSLQFLEKIINKITDQGSIIIASAGNYNKSELFYPAAFKQVVSVWAVDNNNNKASFSNYGPWIDVAAPWVNIITTSLGNLYQWVDGTSESAPLFAWALAWIMSKWWNLETIMDNLTSQNINFGKWTLNLEKACQSLATTYKPWFTNQQYNPETLSGVQDNEVFGTTQWSPNLSKIIMGSIILLLLLMMGYLINKLRR